MFQTDPILWLQSFASEWLTSLMWFVSELGKGRVYVAAAIAIIFGVQLRAGLRLLALLLSSYLLAGVLSFALALPRPRVVDPRVRDFFGSASSPSVCAGPDAPSFWSPVRAEIRACCRAISGLCTGFPSGHLTGTTSFYGGSAMFLRNRGLLLLGLVMVPLVGLSRLYLGMHFLADVLGGVGIGAIGIGTAAALRGRPRLASVLLLSFAAVVFLAKPALALGAGRLVGAVGSTLFLERRGLPSEPGTFGSRLARVVLALGLYYGSLGFLSLIAERGGLAPSSWFHLASGALPISVCLLGTVWLGLRLRLFGPSLSAPAAALP